MDWRGGGLERWWIREVVDWRGGREERWWIGEVVERRGGGLERWWRGEVVDWRGGWRCLPFFHKVIFSSSLMKGSPQ